MNHTSNTSSNMYSRLVRSFALLPYFKGKWRIERLLEKFVKLPSAGIQFPYGFKMKLNGSSDFERGFYVRDIEVETSQYIQHTLNSGDCFWDIGANLGFFSMLASQCVGSTGQVHSFEPTPESFQRLAEHIEMNSMKNITAHNCALSDYNGFASINSPDKVNHGMNFISKHEDGQIIVQIGDDMSLMPPTLIKIDVEGSEPQVIKGLSQTIAKHLPKLIIEFSEPWLNRFNTICEELRDLILSLGPYQCSYPYKGKTQPVDLTHGFPHFKNLGKDHGQNYIFEA